MSGNESRLQALRAAMEAVDSELVTRLGHRQALAAEIGALKGQAGLPVLDPAREAGVVRRAVELGRTHGLADGLVRDIFWRLIAAARGIQTAGPDRGSRGERDVTDPVVGSSNP